MILPLKSYDLGINKESDLNVLQADLEREFTLVMVQERFDESLVKNVCPLRMCMHLRCLVCPLRKQLGQIYSCNDAGAIKFGTLACEHVRIHVSVCGDEYVRFSYICLSVSSTHNSFEWRKANFTLVLRTCLNAFLLADLQKLFTAFFRAIGRFCLKTHCIWIGANSSICHLNLTASLHSCGIMLTIVRAHALSSSTYGTSEYVSYFACFFLLLFPELLQHRIDNRTCG